MKINMASTCTNCGLIVYLDEIFLKAWIAFSISEKNQGRDSLTLISVLFCGIEALPVKI